MLLATGVCATNWRSPARTSGSETIPYILTSKPGTPAYAVIMMPGGKGVMDPRMVDGKLVFSGGGNFLIRSRELFADGLLCRGVDRRHLDSGPYPGNRPGPRAPLWQGRDLSDRHQP